MGVRLLSRLMAAAAALTILSTASAVAATTKGKKDASGDPSSDCDRVILATDTALDFGARFEELPFSALLDSNPETNLAVKHPTIVMDFNQIAYQTILRYPSRKIKDPTYPIVEHDYYPIFSSGLPEAGGAAIIGQYEAIARFVTYTKARAGGQGLGNALMYHGPPGTGKTEFLTIIDRVIANLSSKEPDFYQWTFKFVDLQSIPSLSRVIDPKTGDYLIQPPDDSPLTLLELTPRLRDRIVALAAPRVKKLIGFDPQPFTDMHPQVKEVVMRIIDHYRREEKKTTITEEDYVRYLNKHVRIVRRLIDPTRPPVVVDFQGKHPDPAQLFASENPMLGYVLGQENPLSWRYTGKVLQTHNRVGLYDEAFRNDIGLLNFFLRIVQNGVVEANGAPAVRINSLPILATNDESISAAREEGGTKALLNRLMKEPMRQPIHPILVAETALWMAAERRVEKMFVMRELGKENAPLEPAKLKVLFPEPNDRGELIGPDGRFAAYFVPRDSVLILLAPHALSLLGLTVAGTRLETEVKKLDKYREELDNLKNNIHVYTDVSTRLNTILRRIQQQSAVLRDLRSVQLQLMEGQYGISARDAQRWLLKALAIADERGFEAVTPVTIDKALDEMIKKGEFDDLKGDVAARWKNIHSLIKTDFILPALTADITKILGGDSGLAEKLYREVVEEILVLASNPDDMEWFDEAGARHPIDKERLTEIAKIYEDRSGEQFNLGRVKTFIVNRRDGAPFQPLLTAVENFLLKKELSTATMTELLDYLDGKAVSESTRVRGRQAEISLERFGYNKRAFREALQFVRDQQHELRSRQPRR